MARQGLYANINARKKAGTSRSKSKSTISAKSYSNIYYEQYCFRRKS